MPLAIFDLDNTLLAGDSDYLWGKFLVDQGEVDAQYYEKTNQRFYDDYKAGTLDIFAFQRFSLEPLTRFKPAHREQLRTQFLSEIIQPLVTDEALALVNQHRQREDVLLIITATNSFITTPIAGLFGIDNLLATDPEIIDGKYTGNIAGTPCYKDGKVVRLQTWLKEHNANLDNSYFYSDSHNDLPLLNAVTNPIAVDPDEVLRKHAQQQRWTILNLHHDE